MRIVRRQSRSDLLLFKDSPEISPCLDLTARVHHGILTKPKRLIRAGWQDALKCTLSWIHVHACVLCIQESWLNSNIADTLTSIQDFNVHRLDRQCSVKKTGGGVITCMNSSWSSKSEPIYSYPFSGIGYLAIQCHPKFPGDRSTAIAKTYT